MCEYSDSVAAVMCRRYATQIALYAKKSGTTTASSLYETGLFM